MTLRALIDSLEQLVRDGLPDSSEVRYAAQPTAPFEYSLRSPVRTLVDGRSIAYLTEGHMLGALSWDVAAELWGKAATASNEPF